MDFMKKALIVFGGKSSEHSISLMSARSVIDNIPRDKYEVLSVGITKDGKWYLFEGDSSLLEGERWLTEGKCTRAFVSPDSSVHGIVIADENGARYEKIDVAFPVLHGRNGEDGTIQGLFTMAGIPFVGCSCASSAVCMDKVLTNALADRAGIYQAKWLPALKKDFDEDKNGLMHRAEKKLGYPIFVKPANAGSSVGVGRADDRESLEKAMREAFKEDEKLVLEETVIGREVECAVMGNDEPIASDIGEIVACNEFYDFDAKYVAGTSELHIPALLPEKKRNEIRAAAVNAYKVLGCSGLARVDFFVRESDGAVMLNEPNTIPGFTSISMFPKLFGAAGVSYPDLIDRLLCYAIEKWEDK